MRWAPDVWTGEDKIEHYVFSVFYFGWLVSAIQPSNLAGWLWVSTWFTAGAVGIEVFECVRYLSWEARGKPAPWPWMTDLPSYKDLVWDYAGAATSFLSILLVRGVIKWL